MAVFSQNKTELTEWIHLSLHLWQLKEGWSCPVGVSLIDITCRSLVSSSGCTDSAQVDICPLGLTHTLVKYGPSWLSHHSSDRFFVKYVLGCQMFGLFFLPTSGFTAAGYRFHAERQEVNHQPQQQHTRPFSFFIGSYSCLYCVGCSHWLSSVVNQRADLSPLWNLIFLFFEKFVCLYFRLFEAV